MSQQSTSMLQSHPLPLFFGVLNPNAAPYVPTKVNIKVIVPKFTKEQMEKVFRIQQEELEETDEDEDED